MLEKLDFAGQNIREEQLKALQTDEKTFEWIWNSPFADWLSNRGRMFWIQGRPGSGKSALMQYLTGSQKVVARLERGQPGSWTVLRHFFDFRAGKDERNNMQGLVKSLLRQLFGGKNESDILNLALVVCGSSDQGVNPTSLRAELQSQLQQLVNPILVFLDGLDEFEGDRWDLLMAVRNMTNKNVKICLASRAEPEFVANLKDISSIAMQYHNKPGIARFVNGTLQAMIRDEDFDADSDFVRLKSEIIEESQGVFLWARLVTFELASGFAQGESTQRLLARLH